jgi:hypothetical protein
MILLGIVSKEMSRQRVVYKDSMKTGAFKNKGLKEIVWNSVGKSVVNSIMNSVNDSVWNSVKDSVWGSVWISVGMSVRRSVGNIIVMNFSIKLQTLNENET